MKFLIVLVVFCLSIQADYSKIITKTNSKLIVEVEQSYVIGDGDTRIDARNIALQQAKIKASELAGTFIKAERVIEDDDIKSEMIKTVSTALLESTIKSEKFSITKDQRTKITLIILSELDKRSFLNKLGLLKDDRSKKKQILSLEKENNKLIKELASLNNQLTKLKQSKKLTQKPRQELVKRRDEVFVEIEKNENNIRKVFKKGTLFSLAKKSSSDYEKAKQDISLNIFEYIKNNTKVKLGDPTFRDNGNGTYDILVNVNWKINPNHVTTTINKYFRDYSGRKFKIQNVDFSDHMGTSVPGIKIKKYYNKDENQFLPYTYNLYKYLLKKQINIVVTADHYESKLTIATSRKCFVSCSSSQGDSQYQIHFNNNKNKKEIIFKYNQQNPIVIKSVPKDILENLTSIDAKVIIN